MILTYTFGHSIELNEYKSDYVDDFDYEYEVEPTIDDVIDFLMPQKPADLRNKARRQAFDKGALFALLNAVEYVKDDLREAVLDDSSFEDFMKEKYEAKAMEKLRNEYDDYD